MPNLRSFSGPVRTALVICFCRLQKICWFDDTSEGPEEAIIAEIMPFLQQSMAHSVLGLEILSKLVNEMSAITAELSAAKQRKIAVRLFSVVMKRLRID